MAEKLNISISSDYKNPSRNPEVVQFFLGSNADEEIRNSFSYIYDSETDEVEFSFLKKNLNDSPTEIEVEILYEINKRGEDTRKTAVTLNLTLDGLPVSPTWIARIPAYGRTVREIYKSQSTNQNIYPEDYNPVIGTNFYKSGNKENYITKDSYDDYIRSQNIKNHPLDNVGRINRSSSSYYKIYKTLELRCNALEGNKDSYGNYYSNSREAKSYVVTGLYTYDLYDESKELIRENVTESTSLVTIHNETTGKTQSEIGVLIVPQPDGLGHDESYNYNYVGFLYYEDLNGSVKSIKSKNHITLERFINAEFGGEDGTPVYREQGYPLYILGPLAGNSITISIQLIKRQEGQTNLPAVSNIRFNGVSINSERPIKFNNPSYNYNYPDDDEGEVEPLFLIKDIRYESSTDIGKLVFRVVAASDNNDTNPWRPSYANILPVLEKSSIYYEIEGREVPVNEIYPYFIIQKSTKIGIIPQRYLSRESTAGENLPMGTTGDELGKYILNIEGTIGVKTAFIGISSEVDPYDENIVRNWAITEKLEIGNRERFYFFEKYSGDLLEKIVLFTSVNDMDLPEFYIRDYIDRSDEWRKAIYESEVTIIPKVSNTGAIVDLGGGWTYRLDAPTPFFLGHSLLFVFNNSNRYLVKRFNLYFTGPEHQQINSSSGNTNIFSASINGFNVLGSNPDGNRELDEELGLEYTHYGPHNIIYDQLYPGATPHDLFSLEDENATYDGGNGEPMSYGNTPVKIPIETNSYILSELENIPSSFEEINFNDILLIDGRFYKIAQEEGGYGLTEIDDIINNISTNTIFNINGNTYKIEGLQIIPVDSSSEITIRIELENTILIIPQENINHYYTVVENNGSFELSEVITINSPEESILKIDSNYYLLEVTRSLNRYKSLTSIKATASGDKREIFFGYIGCWGNNVYFDIIYPQKIKNIPASIHKTPSDTYFLRFIFTLLNSSATTDPQEIQFWCGTENVDPLHLLPISGENVELIPQDWSAISGYPQVGLTSEITKFNIASKTVSNEYTDWKVSFPFENRFDYSAPNGTKIINEQTLGEGSFIPDDEKDYLQINLKDDDGGSDIVDFLRIGTSTTNIYYDWKFYIFNRLQSRFEFYSSAGSKDFDITDELGHEITELNLDKIGLYRIYISTLNNLGDGIEAELSFKVKCSGNADIIKNSLFATRGATFGVDGGGSEDASRLINIFRGDPIISNDYDSIEINTSKGSSYILYLWYEGCIGEELKNLDARMTFTYDIKGYPRPLSKTIKLNFLNSGRLINSQTYPNLLDEFFILNPYKCNSNENFEPISPDSLLNIGLKDRQEESTLVGIPIFNQLPGYIELINESSYPYLLALSTETNDFSDWLTQDYRCEIGSPGDSNGDGIESEGCYLKNSCKKSIYKFSVNQEHYYTNEKQQVITIKFQDQEKIGKFIKLVYYPPIDPNQFYLGYSKDLKWVKGKNREYYVNENYIAFLNDDSHIHSWLDNTIRFDYNQAKNDQVISIKKDESGNIDFGANDRLKFKRIIPTLNLELIKTIFTGYDNNGNNLTVTLDNISQSFSSDNKTLRFTDNRPNQGTTRPILRWEESATEGPTFNLKVFCENEVDRGYTATNTPLYLFQWFTSLGVSDECEVVNYFTLAKFKATYGLIKPSNMSNECWSRMYYEDEDQNGFLTSRYFGLALQYRGQIDVIEGDTENTVGNPKILPCTDSGIKYEDQYNPRFLIPLGMFTADNTHTVRIDITEENNLDRLISARNLVSGVKVYYKGEDSSSTSLINSRITSSTNNYIIISIPYTLTGDIIIQLLYTNIDYNCLTGFLYWSKITGGIGSLERQWLDNEHTAAKLDPFNATRDLSMNNSGNSCGIVIKDSQKYRLTLDNETSSTLDLSDTSVGDIIHLINEGYYRIDNRNSSYQLSICRVVQTTTDYWSTTLFRIGDNYYIPKKSENIDEYLLTSRIKNVTLNSTIIYVDAFTYYKIIKDSNGELILQPTTSNTADIYINFQDNSGADILRVYDNNTYIYFTIRKIENEDGDDVYMINKDCIDVITDNSVVLTFPNNSIGYVIKNLNSPTLVAVNKETKSYYRITLNGNKYRIDKAYDLLNSLGKINENTDAAKVLQATLKGFSITLGFTMDPSSSNKTYFVDMQREGYGNAFFIQPGIFYKYNWTHTTGEHYDWVTDTNSGNDIEQVVMHSYWDTTSYEFYKIWYSFYEPVISEGDDGLQNFKGDELLRTAYEENWTWKKGEYSPSQSYMEGLEITRDINDIDHPYREVYILFPQRKNENIFNYIITNRNLPIKEVDNSPFTEDLLVNSSRLSAGDGIFNYTPFSNNETNKYSFGYSENTIENPDYKYYIENPEYYYLVSGYHYLDDEDRTYSLWKPQIDTDNLWIEKGKKWGRTEIQLDGYSYNTPEEIGPWSGALIEKMENNDPYESDIIDYDYYPSHNKISYKSSGTNNEIIYYNIEFLEEP